MFQVKNSSNQPILTFLCWRFCLYQRPSSEEEAGTSSSSSWHGENLNLMCQERSHMRDWVDSCLYVYGLLAQPGKTVWLSVNHWCLGPVIVREPDRLTRLIKEAIYSASKVHSPWIMMKAAINSSHAYDHFLGTSSSSSRRAKNRKN